jgi:hypothetical protein
MQLASEDTACFKDLRPNMRRELNEVTNSSGTVQDILAILFNLVLFLLRICFVLMGVTVFIFWWEI